MRLFQPKSNIRIVAFLALVSVLCPPVFASVQAFSLFGKPARTMPKTETRNIVSLLVEKELFGFTGVKRKIERYARDVQLATNAQVVLVPVPSTASVKEIQEGNAALYFSGLKQDNTSKLIGTVLIGDVPLPVVWDENRPVVSSWLYSDFEDPDYVWDEATKRFVFVGGDSQAEVWQGVIRPYSKQTEKEENLADRVAQLEAYFDNNNAFHRGQIKYGKRVFHANLLFQKKGLPLLMRRSYDNYIKNIEDVLYQRFTKELAKKLLDEQQLEKLVDVNKIPGLENVEMPKMDFSGMPDIFSKNTIQSLQKRYLELYKGYVSQLNQRVSQTGRWDPKLVETTFSLITKKDEQAAKLLKKFNDAVEQKMFQALADSNIPARISIPKGGTVKRYVCHTEYLLKHPNGHGKDVCPRVDDEDSYIHFPDYWNGEKITQFRDGTPTFLGVNTADKCSLLRGGGASGKVVEFNKAFSFQNINDKRTTDKYFCSKDKNLVRACGQIFEGKSLPVTSQARFDALSRFPYVFTTNHWEHVLNKSKKVKNKEPFYKFQFERSPLFDITAAKLATSRKIGASGCHDIIWQINKNRINAKLHKSIESNLQTFSSLTNHVEPTTLTIKTQFSKAMKSPAFDLPIDNPRGVSFYDQEYQFHRISYPNIFDLRGAKTEKLKGLLNKKLVQKIKELNAVSDKDTVLSASVLTDVLKNFQEKDLFEAVRWLDLPLEVKNEQVFTAVLKEVSVARTELGASDFQGFEVLQLFGESAVGQEVGAIKADFERSDELEKSLVFAEAELAESEFQFRKQPTSESVFSKLFVSDNQSTGANTKNGQKSCNRNLLSWTGSCLMPWLSSLPNLFQTRSKLVPKTTDDGTVSADVVVNSGDTNESLVQELRVNPARITLTKNAIQPQKIRVQLLDKTKNILEQDFYSKVEIKTPSGITVNGLSSKTAQAGQVDFFVSVDSDISVGTHTIELIFGKLRQTVPVKIIQEGWVSSVRNRTLTAGNPIGTVIKLWVKDESGNVSEAYDGTRVSISTTGDGTFSNEGSAVIKHGKIEFTYFAGKKAQDITVTVHHSVLPLKKISLEVVPNKPTQVKYKSRSTVFLENSLQPQKVEAVLTDEYGNEVKKSSLFDWRIEGGRLEKTANNAVNVWLNKGVKQVSVSADARILETKAKPLKFSVVKNVQIVPKSLPKIIAGRKSAQIPFEVRHNGKLLSGDLSFGVVVSSAAAGEFPLTVESKNGQGVLSFTPGVMAGTYSGRITIDGAAPQSFSFTILPADPVKIEIDKTSLVRSVKKKKSILKVVAKDRFGNIARSFQDTIRVRVNPVDTGTSYVLPTGITFRPKIEFDTVYGINVSMRDGVGEVEMLPQQVGKYFFLAEKKGLVSSTAVIDFVNTLTPSDFRQLKPQSLLTTLHGWNAGTWNEPNIANSFLFQGETQAVVTESKLANSSWHGWIHPNGQKDSSVQTVLQEGSRPTMIWKSGEKPLAELTLNFSDSPEVQFVDDFDTSARAGIYLKTPSSEQAQFLFENHQLWYKQKPLLSFRKDGGVYFLQSEGKVTSTDYWNRFLVEIPNVPTFWVQFSVASSKNIQVSLLDTSLQTKLQSVLTSTSDTLGLALVSAVSKENTPNETEYSLDTDWVGTQKVATLFGARNSVGNAWRFSAKNHLVLLGDPTVQVATENKSSLIGLTEDLGTPIWQTPNGKDIRQILSSDLNADGKKEIFSLVGDTLYLQFADANGNHIYKDVGPILRFADGVKKLATYEVGNVLKYLIQINDSGELIFFENQSGVLEKTNTRVSLNRVWTDVQLGDMNADSFKDLVLLDDNNMIYIVHGIGSGKFGVGTKLYDFLSKINPVTERFSPNNNTTPNSFEYLSSFEVRFQNKNNKIVQREITDSSFLTTEFQLEPLSKSYIKAKVKASLEILPRVAGTNVEILIPAIEGLVLVPNSLQCVGGKKDCSMQDEDGSLKLSGLSGVVGKRQTVSWEYEIIQIPKISYVVNDFYGKDGIDDVVVPWTTDEGKQQFVLFKSNGDKKQYPTKLNSPAKPKSLFDNLSRALKSQLVTQKEASMTHTHALEYQLSSTEKDFSNLTDVSTLKDLSQKGFDALTEQGFGDTSIEDLMSGMSCGGGCGLNIPSYTFMGPGQQSLYLPPVSFPSIPTLPIPGVGMPSLQIVPFLPFVLPFTPTVPASTFRLFVMPSITGQVGIAACLGVQGTSIPPLPVGNCFAFVPPINLFGGACKNKAKSPLENLTSLFNFGNTGRYSPPVVAETKNKKIIAADIITAWVQAQFEEFSNFKFPAINFVLPRFKTASFKNKQASIWEKLSSSPFLKVQKNPIRIQYPSFSDEDFEGLQSSWKLWKKEYEDWNQNTKQKLSVDEDLKSSLERPLSGLKAKISMSLIADTLSALPQEIATAEKGLTDIEKQILHEEVLGQLEDFESLLSASKSLVVQSEEAAGGVVQNFNKATKQLGNLKSELDQKVKQSKALVVSQSEAISNEGKKVIEDSKQSVATKKSTLSEASVQAKKLMAVKNLRAQLPPRPQTPALKLAIPKQEVGKLLQKLSLSINIKPLENLVSNFEQNMEILRTYKQNQAFLRGIKPKIENLKQQIKDSTNLINEYFVEWQKENKKRVLEWKVFRSQLETTLNAWKSIPRIFAGLTEQCPTCNVNRGTVITWFFKVILGGIKLPVIPLPKFADIIIDLSKAGIGMTVAIPEIELHKTPVNLPNIRNSLPVLDNQVLLPDMSDMLMKTIPSLPIDVAGPATGMAKKIVASGVNIARNITARAQMKIQKGTPSTDVNKLDGVNTNLGSGVVLSKSKVNIPTPSLEKEINLPTPKRFNAVSYMNASIDTSFSRVLNDINLPSISVLPNIPNIPLLPAVPNLSNLPLNLQIPTIDLPQLPLLLPPPTLPNFLAPMTRLMAIPKPFFSLFCYLIQGIIPIPEWKLASHIQEKTNRFELSFGLDFVAAALFKAPKKPDLPDKTIGFEGVYPKRLDDLNEQLESIRDVSSCSVQQLSGKPCETSASTQTTALKRRPEATVVYTTSLAPKMSVETQSRKNEIGAKQLALSARKSWSIQKQNVEKIMASLQKVPRKSVSSRWLASLNPVAVETVKKDLSNVSAVASPVIAYFDVQRGISEPVFKYSLTGQKYASLVVDLNADGFEDILYSINNVLFVKYRKSAKPSRPNWSVIKWDMSDFSNLFVPAKTIDNSTYPNGADTVLQVQDQAVKYYEWRLSNRPDVFWETQRDSAERRSKIWHRVGMLIQSDSRKYQVRPTSAQIVKVKGKATLSAPAKKALPVFEDRASCTDATIHKPFLSSETVLLGTEDNTTFRIETKKRNGELQKSFWKRINKGEEILVDFAEVCVISGGMQVLEFSKPETFQPKAGDYFASGAYLETTPGSEVELLIDGTYEITVRDGETYQIETFENETEFVSAFKKLPIGNTYGVVQAYRPDGVSATRYKLLHDPQGEDDTEPPVIKLTSGNQFTVPVYQPFTIDASESFDLVGIKKIQWQSNDFDTAGETGLTLSVPAQTVPKQLQVEVLMTDFNENQSRQRITIDITPPKVEILKGTTKEILLKSEDAQRTPLTLFRNRNRVTKPLVQNILLEKGLFSLVPQTKRKSIDIWQVVPRKKIAEISETGRVMILDARFRVKVVPSTNKTPPQIQIQALNGLVIGKLDLNFASKQVLGFDSKANIVVEDLVLSDQFVWQKFHTNTAGLKGALALVNKRTHKTVVVLDVWGNFYALNPTMNFMLAAGKLSDPLIIAIKHHQNTVGTFTLPAKPIVAQ
ncbi:hypothetical protein CSB37_00360 [bacterium DOLZORAL124_38_8]|nr:MAG: hypothetical protein CSB37_00360 [bacterium DOLZORAL124_38_8]